MTPSTDTTHELTPVADHRAWMPIALEAYRRLADAFAELDGADWERPTPCADWTVRDLAGHLVGAMRSAARLREFASQQREIRARVKRTGENETDAMTAVQVARAAPLTPAEVVAELRALREPAVKGRARVPGLVRRAVRFPVEVGSIKERWNLDYLTGCILTRDAWLHRIDLADALDVAPLLDDHDRVIIGDAAAEWARRHGRPIHLSLTGPAGGRLVTGTGGEALVVDAVEFCRVLSGRRRHAHPLMSQEVPF